MKALCTVFCLLSVVLVLAIAGCGDSTSQGKEKVYEIKGKVTAVDPAKTSVTIDHEEIPGFMKAMTMEFKASDAKLLENMKPGDQVHGKLKVGPNGEYAISELHKDSK